MINVLVSPLAEEDLDALWEVDEDTAAEIETALDEIANNPKLMERLTEQKYRNIDLPSFEVDAFRALWNQGLCLYRLKFWDYQGSLLPYRVLYAHHPQNDVFHVLAVVPRNFNYDTSHPIVTRVRAQYDELGIPTY